MSSEGGAVRIRITRRGFLKLGAATAAAVAVASAVSKIPFSRAVMMNDGPSSVAGQSTSSGLYPVYCRAGGSACSLQLSVDSSGRPVWIRPNLASPQAGECGRGASGVWLWDHPLRLSSPLRNVGSKGNPKWESVTWEEALDDIASRLQDIISKYGPQSVAVTSHWMPEFSTLGILLGTPNNAILHHGTCLGASGIARVAIFGAGTASPFALIPDLANARYVLAIGRNFNCTMGELRALSAARDNNVQVVIVDPKMPNVALPVETWWLPIKPGTDAAFALAIANYIIQNGLYDAQFLKSSTDAPFLIKPDGTPLTGADMGWGNSDFAVYDEYAGAIVSYRSSQSPSLEYSGSATLGNGSTVRVTTAFNLLAQRASKYTPQVASGITGIAADEIVSVAREFANMRGVAYTGWWSARNGNDVDDWRAIDILNVLVGNVERPGGLLFPVPGGVPSFVSISGKTIKSVFGGSAPAPSSLSQYPRVDWYRWPILQKAGVSQFKGVVEAALTGEPYPIKALFIVATEPLHRDVDIVRLKEALESMDLVVVIDVLPQDIIDYADYVLPDSIYLEREEVTSISDTPDFAVEYSYPALSPPQDNDSRPMLWAMMEIVKRVNPSMAAALGYTEQMSSDPWGFQRKVTEAKISALAKSYGMDPESFLSELRSQGFMVLKKHSYGLPALKTPSGRIEIYSLFALQNGLDPLPDYAPPAYKQPSAPDEFVLITGKDYQVTLQAAWLLPMKWLAREMRMIWMNPSDAERLGLGTGDIVQLTSLDTGESATGSVLVTDRVAPGVLFVPQAMGGHTSSMITEEFSWLREGVNPNVLNPGVVSSVGISVLNASVKVTKI
jgi:anaerobic selenocysteine-containing dehydrogenase